MPTIAEVKVFRPNKVFKEKYDSLFLRDPMLANFFLFICEIADERGEIRTNEYDLMRLMRARFNDPREYALKVKENE